MLELVKRWKKSISSSRRRLCGCACGDILSSDWMLGNGNGHVREHVHVVAYNYIVGSLTVCIKINGIYYPFHRVEDCPHALKKVGQMAEKLSLWKNMEPSQRNANGKNSQNNRFKSLGSIEVLYFLMENAGAYGAGYHSQTASQGVRKYSLYERVHNKVGGRYQEHVNISHHNESLLRIGEEVECLDQERRLCYAHDERDEVSRPRDHVSGGRVHMISASFRDFGSSHVSTQSTQPPFLWSETC